MTGVRALLGGLTNPPASSSGEAADSTVLFRVLVAVFAVMVFVGAVARWVARDHFAVDMVVTSALLAVAYLLATTRARPLAVAIALVSFGLPSYVGLMQTGVVNADPLFELFLWMALPMVMSLLITSIRGVVITSLGNLTAAVVLAAVLPTSNLAKVGGVVSFLATVAVITVTAGVLRERNRRALQRELEERRRAEADRRRLEAQLLHAQKLESIGTLAGGVAHDINNTLHGILLAASSLKEELPGKVEAQQDVEMIVEACRRGRDLTGNLLAFARQEEARVESVSLPDLISKVVGLLERAVPRTITLRTELPADLAPIRGDSTQLHLALMNICVNATDAMGERGELSLVGREVSLPGGNGRPPADLPSGRYLRLDVVDTGAGMSAEVRARAFDPFFTTKPVGAGTGLGLSTAYGIVSHHGGTVELDSEPGRGTTVTLFLPVAAPGAFAGETAGLPATPAAGATGNGTILLVDDEEAIRHSGERLLRRLGYRVLVARDGEEAVRLYGQRSEPIALVLLDVIMPVMDGEEAFRRLREQDPQLRVLISTGYSKADKVEALLALGAVGILNKPFELQTLAAAVSEAIAADG